MLPPRLIDRLPAEARVVEVGVGGRFEALEALAERLPGAQLVATDVHEAALQGAPEGVETVVDDVADPDPRIYEGADLLYAIRCPAELQIPLARVADRVGAHLALRAFKDEWADVDRILGPHELVSTPTGAWRLFEPR